MTIETSPGGSVSNARLIETFYQAFDRHDAEAMVACYADDVVFRDPAFGELRGEQARDMWRMLCRTGKDLRVEVAGIRAAGDAGRCHWVADYTFTTTNRKVHNEVDANFDFRDGLIWRHTDEFSFPKWSSQAFGPVGSVLGRTPILPFMLTKVARHQLSQFSQRAS